jgi:outer membrane lipoprotein-sorting protein
MRVFPRRRIFIALLILVAVASSAVAQSGTTKKLPSAEKIVSNYLKAIGGKKAAAAQRDVTYEWIVNFNNQPIGVARTLRKAPASERFELTFGNGQIISATNARSAWELGLDKQLHTLTTLEAATAKLQATLAASHLVDFKKANVLARFVSIGDPTGEPAYVVEFSTRSGARVQYYFSLNSKLITKITSDTKKTRLVFEDYRRELGLLEPHRARISLEDSGELTLILQSVKQTTGISDQLFDPPAAAETLDVAALLREVAKNQDATEERVAEYSFKQTETDRTINDKGEVKKES